MRNLLIEDNTFDENVDSVHLIRFRNEARVTAQMNHTNIVPVHAVGEIEGVPYIVMQFIEGSNLHDVVRGIRSELSTGEFRTSGGQRATTIPAARQRQQTSIHLSGNDYLEVVKGNFTSRRQGTKVVARLGVQVARALQHAHNHGIVHRDIKPGNLMLDEDGKIWVTDFGLALIRQGPAISRSGVALGTLRYMSPEQATGRRGLVDQRSDIY